MRFWRAVRALGRKRAPVTLDDWRETANAAVPTNPQLAERAARLAHRQTEAESKRPRERDA